MPLPVELPFSFGDLVVVFDKIIDHADAAVSRLIEQYRDKPNVAALVAVTGKRAQRLEDELWKLYTERWVDTGSGEQLDLIGRIVKQPRQALADVDYRLFLKARVRLNRSSGTVEDLLEIFTLITDAGTTMRFVPLYPAAFRLELGVTGFSASIISIMLSFFRTARAGGVYGVIHWITGTEGDSFCFDTGPGLGFGSTLDSSVGGKLAGISP